MFLKIKNPNEKSVHGGHCMPVAATDTEGEQPLGERGQRAAVPLKFSTPI